MPITWRNIESDHTRGAASLFETARRALNDGMGNFKSIVDSRNELNQQNWDTQKAVNTDLFLDRLAQYKTPEELAAAQEAGQLQALKAQFGGQIDRDAVRGAEAAAAEQLMKRITAQNLYQDDTRRRGERDQMDVGRQLLLGKKYDEFDKWAAENNLLDEPELHELKRTYQRQDGQDSRAERQLGISLNRANQENIRFKQEQDALNRKQFIGQQAAQITQEFQQYEKATHNEMVSAAKDLGLSVDDDGLPVFSEDPKGQVQQREYAYELARRGINPMSPTERINGALARIMSAPEMNGAGIDELLVISKALNQGVNAVNQLDPTTQAKLDAAKAAEDEKLKIVLAARKEGQQSEAATNPFYNPTKDVEKSTANIMSKLPKDFSPVGWDSHQKQLLESKVREYLSEGMSEDFVLNAVNTVAEMGTWTADTDDNFNDYMDEYFPVTKLAELKQLANGVVDENGRVIAPGLRTKHAQELRALELQALENQKKLERAFRKSQGLTPEASAETLRRLSSLLKAK